MNITLHIGSAKTGSSTIQAYLASHETWLRQHGWFVPRALKPHRDYDNQIVLPALFCDEQFKGVVRRLAGQRLKGSDWEFESRVAARLQEEICDARESGMREMLVSSEHLVLRLRNRRQIGELRRWLERFGEIARIVVYLRRQDELFTSLYSTHIKSGSLAPFEYKTHLHNNLTFNHKKMLKRWLNVFDTTTFVVRPYNPRTFVNGNLLDDFFDILGLDGTGPSGFQDRNPSLDPEGLAIVRAFNRITRKVSEPQRVRPVREALIRVVAASDTGTRVSLSAEETEELLASFVDCNRWLTEKYTKEEFFFDRNVDEMQTHSGLPDVTLCRVMRRLYRGIANLSI